MAIQYCNYDIKGTLAVTGTSTLAGTVTIVESTSSPLLNIYNTSNGSGATIKFSDIVSQTQTGTITYVHSDTQSYGSGNAFVLTGDQATMTILADGKLMYKEGVYLKPASGTGGGTRKDNLWDSAYTKTNAFTTIGTNFTTIPDVSVVSYTRINANETVSLLSASQFLTAIGGAPATGGSYLPLVGGIMTGAIDMSSNSAILLDNSNNNNQYYIRNGGTSSATFQVGTGTPGSNIKLTLNGDGDATFAGDVTINGSHLVLANGTTTAQSTDYLYIGGSGLASSDAAIYIGNQGAGGGYGYRIYYDGTGSGNNNKLILKSENIGTNVDMLSFTADGNATFAGNVDVDGNILVGDSHFIGDDADDNLLIASSANENIIIRSQDSFIVRTGGDNTRFQINASGNATFAGQVNGITPTSAANLTRKDYVDAAVAGAGTVTSVGATAPILSSGGTTPVISAKLVNVSGNWWNGGLVQVATDGVAEIGKYIDMHAADAATSDFDVRLTATTGKLNVSGALEVNSRLSADGGIEGLTLANGGISGSNYDITGVNQLKIADPGEGIVFGGGAGGDITLAIIDDAADNILNLNAAAAFNVNAKITSLTNPTAAQDAATKSYVDTQIATIPSGLNFQGNWNASTNSPTLASGTGTPGFYYNVSVAGSTDLDGETDWEVGDWAVFVENNTNDFWEKIDNTSALTGTGVAGRVAYWDSTNNLTQDSDLTFNGSSLVVGGTVTAQTGNSVEWNSAYQDTITAFSDSGSSTITLTLTQRDGGTLTTSFSNPQGTVTKSGTPVNNQLAVWTSATNIEGESELTYDGNTLSVGGSANTSTFLDVVGTNTAGAPARSAAVRIYGYEGRGEGIFYYDTAFANDEWYSGIPYSGGSSYQIGFDTSGGQAEYVANSVLRIYATGQIQFNNYGQSTFSGTVTTYPAFTGDGKIVDRTPAQVLSDIGGAPATGGTYLPLIGGTLTGGLAGTTASFNAGTTNVVATFTSTDGIAGIALVDNSGNVELSASGNTFQVQPAGGAAALTVSSTSATFAGNAIFTNGAAFASAASIRQQSDILILTGGGNGFAFNDDTNAVSNLLINAGGEATFSSSATFGGDVLTSKSINSALSSTVSNSNSGNASQSRFVAISNGGNIQLKSTSTLNTTYGDGDEGVINCDTMSGGFKIAHNDVVKYTLSFAGENTWTGGGTFKGSSGVEILNGTGGTTSKLLFRNSDNNDSSAFIRKLGYYLQFSSNQNEGFKFTDLQNSTQLLQLNGGNNGSGNGVNSATFAGSGFFAGDLTVSGGDISLGGTGRIQGVDTVSAGTDAANKDYVDTAVAGSGSGTVTSVSSATTSQLTVSQSSPAPALSIVTAAVANGGTGLATGNQIYDWGVAAFAPIVSGGYLPLSGGTMTGNTSHTDAATSFWGSSNQLVITHDGSNGYIKNTVNGDLYIRQEVDNKDIIFQSDDGAGGVETYFFLDGSVSSGSPVTIFPDNSQLMFGDALDLRISHDGSNSYINETGAGSLIVKSTALLVRNPSDASMISAFSTGAVNLYYNGVEKFHTSGTGVDVIGNLDVSGSVVIDTNATINGQLNQNGDIKLGASASIVLDDTPTGQTTSGSGTIVEWSVSTSVSAGLLYVVKSDGGWTTADADSEAKSTAMAAIALGGNATSGMLLQGFFYKSNHGFAIGSPLYISNTSGAFSNSRPTGAGDYVRIIGYATSTNFIYFDPDKTWVKID